MRLPRELVSKSYLMRLRKKSSQKAHGTIRPHVEDSAQLGGSTHEIQMSCNNSPVNPTLCLFDLGRRATDLDRTIRCYLITT